MRFLADMGVSNRVVAWLDERGHGATHLQDQGLSLEAGAVISVEDARHRVRSLPIGRE